jgi:transposase
MRGMATSPAAKTTAASAPATAPATAPARKRPGPPAVAQDKAAAYGIDAICADLVGGETYTAIARKLGVSISKLTEWIEKDPERNARAREARRSSAKAWDERAEEVLATAADNFELAKARELAHHYRWRAKAIAPREYGDKQILAGDNENPIAVDVEVNSEVFDTILETLKLERQKE